MSEDVPASRRSPVELALAKAVAAAPAEDALPGGCLSKPKWTAIVFAFWPALAGSLCFRARARIRRAISPIFAEGATAQILLVASRYFCLIADGLRISFRPGADLVIATLSEKHAPSGGDSDFQNMAFSDIWYSALVLADCLLDTVARVTAGVPLHVIHSRMHIITGWTQLKP